MDAEVVPLQHARTEILACQGFGLADLAFSIVEAADAITMNLRFGPQSPDLAISARSIHYFAIHRVPGEDVPFFDFDATVLIPGEPWPEALPCPIATVPDFPPLLWVHGDGPACFDLVAAVFTILRERAVN